jgi:hypothetical protein
MMRLIDREPHWIGYAKGPASQWSADDPFYFGVSFLCPACIVKKCPTCGHESGGHRVAVSFWPPIDPGGWNGKISGFDASVTSKFHQRADGDTFAELTLTPSVSLEHWHGNITNGELTTARG